MSNMYGYNTSSAYKLNSDFDTYRQTSGRELHKIENKERKETRTNTVSKKKSAVNLKNFLKVAVCFAVAFVIVNGYVKINEAYNNVASLEAEYNDIIAANQDLQVKIDKAVDLAKLQTVANEKFGMVRPERYQMFYVDMQQEDAAEIYADKDDSASPVAVKGVEGTITGAMNIFK